MEQKKQNSRAAYRVKDSVEGAIKQGEKFIWGTLTDISATGFGFHTQDARLRFTQGEEITLMWTDADTGQMHLHKAKVAVSRKQDDGTFIVGGEILESINKMEADTIRDIEKYSAKKQIAQARALHQKKTKKTPGGGFGSHHKW